MGKWAALSRELSSRWNSVVTSSQRKDPGCGGGVGEWGFALRG